MSAAREHALSVNGLAYSLQSWGDDAGTRVLALHGWLDNSESFAPLAKHWQGVHIVAPDLAGHGRSAHRPLSGSYNIWDDLRELLQIADALGWQRFSLLGHSRGAMIAMLLAASMPDRIEKAAFIDGFWPLPQSPEAAPEQLGRHLHDFNRVRSEAPLFACVADAVKARQGDTRLPADLLEPMVRRNLQAAGDGWRWSTDARLRYASAFKLSDAHNRAFAKAVQCPNLIVLAEKGMAEYRDMVTAIQALPNLRMQTMPGDHHLHMTSPAAVVECLEPFF
ncbi:MAG TPA: alpha/beta fold hydrolase [Pseudomonadales bacterium]